MLSVAVFGSSLPREASPGYEEARRLGREIALRRARVVCGGYAGVMEAACRGASEAGGPSLGVLLEGGGDGNAWLTERLRVRDLSARLRALRDESDAWIFLPRGLGTMLELVWIAESIVKGDVLAKPFILLGGFWRDTVQLALSEASNPRGKDSLTRCVRFAGSPAEAVSLALPQSASSDLA